MVNVGKAFPILGSDTSKDARERRGYMKCFKMKEGGLTGRASKRCKINKKTLY